MLVTHNTVDPRIVAEQAERNAREHEIKTLVGNDFLNHPLATVVVAAKKLIGKSREDAEEAKRRELEELARHEAICHSYIDKKAAFDALADEVKNCAESIDAIQETPEAAAERILRHRRGNFTITLADVRDFAIARSAAAAKPFFIAEVERRIAERRQILDEFTAANKAVLKKYGLI